MPRRGLFITPLNIMRRCIVDLFPMIGEVEQEAVGIGGFVVVNQASQHMVIEMVSVIIGIIRCQLIRA